MRRDGFISRYRRGRKHTLAKTAGKDRRPAKAEGKVMQKENAVVGEEAHIWHEMQELVKKMISYVSYETWIEPCRVLSYTKGSLVIAVEDEFIKDVVESRYLSVLRDAACKVTEEETTVVLQVAGWCK